MKPVIGITPSVSTEGPGAPRYAISTSYTEAVEAAGGIPLVIPPQQGNADEILSALDGLLLSGGGDIRPERYGDQTYHAATYGIYDPRDELELGLVRSAIARDMPILCICRGIQLLNVALGGTLVQDIADQIGTDVEHRQSKLEIPAAEPAHPVTVQANSLLEQVYGATALQTNSFHHQALKEVSPELRVVGRAADGVVEAVERPGSRWLLGLQWHPEMMFRAHDEHLRPFQALIAAATSDVREHAAADD